MSAVAKAAPDGYTFLVATVGEITINPSLFKEMPYDVERDLAPIDLAQRHALRVRRQAASPYKTMADVIAAAKARPGKISVATPGNGSVNQIIMRMDGLSTGTKFQHIPYKGGAPAAGVARRRRHARGVLASSSVTPHVRSGRMRMLAITTAKRSPLNPDRPTLQDSGVADVDGTNWTALYAPKATPQPIIDKLNAEVVKILAMPDVKERFAAGGATTIPSTPAEVAARIERETAAFKTIITRANIQAE